MGTLRLVCLSDTHNLHGRVDVPDGDVLLHAGDFTARGTVREVEAFGAFLARLPHREKIVIAGNHDFLFQRDPERARALLGDVTYLEDSLARIGSLTVWGSPWQPWFHDWAFNLPRGTPLAEKWALVPESVGVLVTHGPPLGVLDTTFDGSRVGCEELARALQRIRPRMHLFGHIHEAYGTERADGILSVNACACDLRYRAAHPPVVVDWDGEELRLVSGAGAS
jgi:predicted phosphodiesterase